MAEILILGAGLGGLGTAMLVAREGHQVTVLERDPVAPPRPEHADAAWETGRGAASTSSGCRISCCPAGGACAGGTARGPVPAGAAGALQLNMLAQLPAARRGPMRDGDERFDTVTARRPVLEAALSAAPKPPG